jgi:hypothetical protein
MEALEVEPGKRSSITPEVQSRYLTKNGGTTRGNGDDPQKGTVKYPYSQPK